MKHLKEAHAAVKKENSFVKVDAKKHSVTFTIQDGPIKEVGENGCQAADMIDYVTELFISLDKAFPCSENKGTIRHLERAKMFQDKRTQDREARDVEGLNKA